MKIRRIMTAALTGLSLLCMNAPDMAQANGLRVVKRGTSVTLDVPMNRAVVVESDDPFAELSIANPNIADISSLSDRTIYVLGKSPGLTTLTLLDASGQLITNVNVRVAADVSEFKQRLGQILPGEKIEVRTANDGIVLSGNVSSAARLQRALDLAERYAPERVSNLMSVGGVQQVMLKVRFAEMQRSVSKALHSSIALGSQHGNTAGETGQFLVGSNGLGSPLEVKDGIAGALAFQFGIGSMQVGLLLEALEKKGVVRTLAEPNLSALSGQEAKFLAGGEYPIPVAQEGGTFSIEFKPFGIELNFIPRVVDGDLINLELRAAVSAIDTTNSVTTGGVEVSAFSRRETSTTVELRDGESFAVAGLVQDDFLDNSSQVPWIGDVPILGSLFRSADYQRNQTELVIIVSAHLVTPTRGEALSLPTDRIKPPSEAELFLLGRTANTQKGPASEVARQDFNGSYGYVMD
ncbi:type II and III secretion system protein family protein [Pseudophaeobacter flagellatus]|uniref:type II and III secretion system protein family protein n=1 Tax=Pseudophaeobacter flagellatus TaxID=2899119 RepID=UPI001E5E2FEA|nr:type II and III secretion system protein family protein [Pseudophaeobacter flagellatus]MCD9148423.1 type II and III secretion system protein family protein [Pseudophaeobacter flagellatus]